jgi:hypothetical protein
MIKRFQADSDILICSQLRIPFLCIRLALSSKIVAAGLSRLFALQAALLQIIQ